MNRLQGFKNAPVLNYSVTSVFVDVARNHALWSVRAALGLERTRAAIAGARLFGVNPYEGNHGEDVKEYYFHVDNTPTHSYMCLLYKYPQAAFPYCELIEHNQRRAGQGPEYELLDTGAVTLCLRFTDKPTPGAAW